MSDISKYLVEQYKELGLEIAEETAEKVLKKTVEIVPEVCKMTETKWDDLIVIPILAVIQPELLKIIDKIDGKEDITE